MANHKSARKRARQTIRKTQVNKTKRSKVKTFIKKLRASIIENNTEEASKNLIIVQKVLAKTAKSSAFNKNRAARLTSRLASQVFQLSKSS